MNVERAARARSGVSASLEDSRPGLQDDDTTVLLGVVVTPIVGIRGPTQLLGVEPESRRVGSVRVVLHDVPGEDTEYDAVAGPGTDPPQGADGAPRSGVWQRARDIVAHEPRGFAVHTAGVLTVLKIQLFCHLPPNHRHVVPGG